jgi:hypothetical protein
MCARRLRADLSGVALAHPEDDVLVGQRAATLRDPVASVSAGELHPGCLM